MFLSNHLIISLVLGERVAWVDFSRMNILFPSQDYRSGLLDKSALVVFFKGSVHLELERPSGIFLRPSNWMCVRLVLECAIGYTNIDICRNRWQCLVRGKDCWDLSMLKTNIFSQNLNTRFKDHRECRHLDVVYHKSLHLCIGSNVIGLGFK